MNILESKIFDIINLILNKVQNITDKLRQNSFILSNIDFIIILAIIATYFVSSFAATEVIGAVSFIVPALVALKVLITKGEKIELERWNFFLIIYLLICLISNFTSSMMPQSFYGFSKTLLYFGFYFALCQFLKDKNKYIPLILSIIALLVCYECFIGIFQNIIKVESISTWQDTSYVNPEDVLSRVYGTLKPYNPNLFGGYLIASYPALLAIFQIFIYKRNKIASIFLGILALLGAYTIFLTGCRGAYIALFFMFIGVIIFNFKKIKRYLSIMAAAIAVFIAINHSILNRFRSIFIMRGDSSTSFRLNVYNSAIQMFQDNPICGVGVGNKVFREIYGLYMLSGFDALSCYCVFLEMAVESGIFALLAYLLFLGSLITNSIKKLITIDDYQNKIIIFSALIAIIGVMIHGFVDTVYFRPQIQYIFWTMAAILTSMIRSEK